MNLVDAFLLASGTAYVAAAVLPEPILKKPKMLKPFEAAIFGVFGAAILLNLAIYEMDSVWLIVGFIEAITCVLTFGGYQIWNVLWKTEASDAAQIGMWAWDLMIAVSCFMKMGFTF